MSEASSPSPASPSPMPMMSGDTRRPATIVPGSPALTTARAKAPRTSRSVARTASASEAPPASSLSTRWAMTSVSVSDDEGVPLGAQLLGQLAPVLDDAVVHDGEVAGAVQVGVGVGLGGVPVGGPPGVADAGGHALGTVFDHLAQVLERAGAGRRPGPATGPVGLQGHPGGVVAPVLETLEPVEQDAQDLARPRWPR